MNDHTLLPFDLPSVCPKKLTVDFNGGNQSSNGGLLGAGRYVVGISRGAVSGQLMVSDQAARSIG
jgi:hypothetical protein